MSYLLELISEHPVYDFIIDKYYRNMASGTTFFGDKYKLKIFQGFQFTGFFKEHIEKLKTPTKLKLHYAVDHRDLEKALEIIGSICNKYDIPGFKVINYPFGIDFDHPDHPPKKHHQDGKDFTIYIGKNQDTPEFMNKFTQEIEQSLIQNGVRPAKNVGYNLSYGDKQINGSIFGYYRYEKHLYNYNFTIPECGDVMESVSVKIKSETPELQTLYCNSFEELLENQKLLKALDIPFNIDTNSNCQSSNQAKYRLCYYDNLESKEILKALNQKSLDDMFLYQKQDSVLIKRIQNTLNKINWESVVLLDYSNPECKTDSLFVPNKKQLQYIMHQTKINNLSQMDVFPLISRDETLRVQALLLDQDIPTVRFAYTTKNNTQQYCLIFKNDAHIRSAILQTKPKLAMPNTERPSVRNTYISKMSHQFS